MFLPIISLKPHVGRQSHLPTYFSGDGPRHQAAHNLRMEQSTSQHVSPSRAFERRLYHILVRYCGPHFELSHPAFEQGWFHTALVDHDDSVLRPSKDTDHFSSTQTITMRKPMRLRRVVEEKLFRLPEVQNAASSSQLPPRTTRGASGGSGSELVALTSRSFV